MIAKAKKLLVYVGEYKKATILSLVFIILEVVMEVLIPFITADLVNRIKNGRGMDEVLLIGGAMVIAALFSLFFGSYAGINSARAS
ncbi:MAG: ABC transporter ATP-binding protein, partial [Clostridiales bacterium]|nr:ABC transporter ATP-binding protein [Clostridiales bacterium]